MRDAMNGALLDKKERKALAKARKKEAKAAAKARRGQEPGKRIYVLAFKGDMRASAVKRLGSRDRRRADRVARPGTDEAMIRIESPGGTVTGYGLAAAEILRLREHKIKVTASVDQVAASGGYMMACAADRIVAAPFAVVGSIGVVAPVPNLHRLLKKNEIDFEEMTAGEFKRTVSVLGEITPAGARAFPRQARRDARGVQDPCRANAGRRSISPKSPTATIGLRARRSRLGLVDEIATGDELLFRARDERAPLRGHDGSAQDPAAAVAQRPRRRGAEGGGFRGGAASLAGCSRARSSGPTVRLSVERSRRLRAGMTRPRRTAHLQLVAVDDRARIARHVIEDAALNERVHARRGGTGSARCGCRSRSRSRRSPTLARAVARWSSAAARRSRRSRVRARIDGEAERDAHR